MGDHLADLQPPTMSHISLILQMRKLIFCKDFNVSKAMPLTNAAKMNVNINTWDYTKISIQQNVEPVYRIGGNICKPYIRKGINI